METRLKAYQFFLLKIVLVGFVYQNPTIDPLKDEVSRK